MFRYNMTGKLNYVFSFLLFHLLTCHHALGQVIQCGNSDSAVVKIKGVNRNCIWVKAKAASRCKLNDSSTKKPAGFVCAKECPSISGCDVIPTAPYIFANISSSVAKLPKAPKSGFYTKPTRCPHLAKGLKNWHSAVTWGGKIPLAGQDVTLPAKTRVLLDRTIPYELGIITIPATSELIIGKNDTGINIDAHGFMVLGKLTAGSPTCRLTTPVSITLHGTRPSNAVLVPPPSTYKGLIVSGGKLSLHGERFYQTWTRLAKTIKPGGNVVMLQEPVNWKVGQEIVLVTSTMKDSRDVNQNEIHTIKALNTTTSFGIGSIVYLTNSVKYEHVANQYYQVEVGLLTRTIKIQGAADDSEATDPDPLNCRDRDADQSWVIWYNTTKPCGNKHLTGFGGHVRIENNGTGQVQGVELYRMGQTNVKGRYPFHFHLLGSCPTCYIRDSSIHHSFYRCVAIHGTHKSLVTENVAYDVVGYCYYLEDGIEQNNTISYNLAAHIHTIGPDFPRELGQQLPLYVENENLTLPADITASGFYITNVDNNIIGNAASGGWAGFAFPNVAEPLNTFRTSGYRPLLALGLTIDGNTAHSTGWWWFQAGAFYFGGDLYHRESDSKLEYNPGRSFRSSRDPCSVDPCYYGYCGGCPNGGKGWLKMSNTKTFLTAGIGVNSWTGRAEIVGYESYDSRLSMAALSGGFWMDNALVVCRTGQDLGFNNANLLDANGFVWYDTDQSHIITRTTFRNCGYRNSTNQYDKSPTRGCADDTKNGCSRSSSVFGFVTHSDQFTPEIMQGTRDIKFENCGRRFRFSNAQLDSVSGRAQNWLDNDGSISGLGVQTLIGSGLSTVKDWWGVDDEVVYDTEAPLRFIKKDSGPERSIGHVSLRWDPINDAVGNTLCGNGNNLPCPWEGFIRHAGKKFSPFINGSVTKGMPVTARGDIAGPIGGYGWILNFNKTAPRTLNFTEAEIDPSSTMMISIPYPIGTKFNLRAMAPSWCGTWGNYSCFEDFQAVSSIAAVRNGAGNTYFVDSTGVITFRMAQTSMSSTGHPLWSLPTYSSPPRSEIELYALNRFERGGVLLPNQNGGNKYKLSATCPGESGTITTGYCPGSVNVNYDPDVCPSSAYVQVAYDRCCQIADLKKCVFANGSQNF